MATHPICDGVTGSHSIGWSSAWGQYYLLAVFILASFLLSHSVEAGQYEDGLAAIRHGDYETAVKLLKPLAEQGDPAAQADIGALYETGQGVDQNYEIAISWYRKSAEQGFALGQTRLGVMYEQGKGLRQNYKEAIRLYRRAADRGFVEGEANLCGMYMNGKGVPQDYTEANKWCRLAADKDDARSQYHLALNYDNGRGVPKSEDEAFRWYKRSAELGFPRGQLNLGFIYMFGEGERRDGGLGMLWMAKAAENRLSEAFVALAAGNQFGIGVPKNPRRAEFWYREAVSAGNPNGFLGIGRLAKEGLSDPMIPPKELAYAALSMAAKLAGQDTQRSDARKLLEEVERSMTRKELAAAKRRLQEATVGGISDYREHQRNRCSIVDVLVSTEPGNIGNDCRRLAALGIPVAEYNLGWMSLYGINARSDAKAGIDWLKRAAEDDFPAAELQLGVQFESGENIKRDLRQALAWFLIATDRLPGAGLTENYYQQAVESISDLKGKLSTVDQQWADQWVKDWNTKHVLSSQAPEQCNYWQIDAQHMTAIFDTAYKDLEIKDTTRIYTNARTIGGNCSFIFLPQYGEEVRLAKSTIETPPEKGTLAKSKDLSFLYSPPLKYKGIDRFTLEICGARRDRPNVCFPIEYAVEVHCSGESECGSSSVPKNIDKKL